jgi:hypothetical protein
MFKRGLPFLPIMTHDVAIIIFVLVSSVIYHASLLVISSVVSIAAAHCATENFGAYADEGR